MPVPFFVREKATPEPARSIVGVWSLETNGRTYLRTFKADGTFTGNVNGKWRLVGKTIEMTMENGNHSRLLLPIDPKGVKGIGIDGNPIVATKKEP